ncbi:MAG: SGNH/GDSL hydrolase family protein [Pseudonocardiales bacterium]|nr:SGNH/GDSL hydrolase family protein [Pseudonocardiales bacterium]
MYRRAVLAAAATALALLGLPTTGTAETVSSPKHYVALGDSYASGPGIPEQRTDPIGCQRSTRNYPALLARALRIRDYTDVSCGGARTDNMTAPQPVRLGPNPPQFDALRRHTDLVTITIGGNDIDIGALWLTCARLGPTDPSGDPCKRQATAGGTDLCAQRIAGAAPKVARVLAGVRARSPHATVLLVGYLRILPPTTGCYPAFPIARGDVPYVDGVERQLTAMLADQANNHGAVFVDSYAGSLGHDACQQPGVKWVEGPAPTSAAAPDHPNVIGMREVAGFALDPLRDRNGG